MSVCFAFQPAFMAEEPIGNSVSGALAYLQSKGAIITTPPAAASAAFSAALVLAGVLRVLEFRDYLLWLMVCGFVDFFSLDKIRRRRGHHLEQPLHNTENEKEVNIDYRDAFGNVMVCANPKPSCMHANGGILILSHSIRISLPVHSNR